jgi:AraC-like DNA-binding protein
MASKPHPPQDLVRGGLTRSFNVCSGVELQHARIVGHRFPPHFHEEFQILLLMDGALRLDLNGSEYALERPAVCLINPGEIHAASSSGWGWEVRNFYVPHAIAHSLVGRRARFAVAALNDDDLWRALALTHQIATAAPFEESSRTQLIRVLTMLFDLHTGSVESFGGVHRNAIRKAEDYLRVHFAETVRVDTLAHLANLSPFHFLRVFAGATGLSPHAYQNQLRVAHAVRRLREGAPAAEAATESGYYDHSHLIRALRRSHGVTPEMIRRATTHARM